MLIPHSILTILSVGLMVMGAGVVSGQTYPNKPISIVTAGVGTQLDFVARLIAPGLTESLDKQIVVINRGIIAIETVAKAPPDGYILLFYTSAVWLMPFMRDNVPWDPVRDFSPITLVANSPNILVVHPSLPVKSVKALIALAKARPGELNYGSSPGGSSHLSAELFKAMADVNIVRVNYKGTGQALGGLVTGEVHLVFATGGSLAPYLHSGRLRVLAVTTAQSSALTPDLPTVAASGLPGYESLSLLGIFAPAKTPTTIVNRLNQEIVRVLNRADVKERLSNIGVEVIGSSPEQFAATVKSEMLRWGKVIKDAGIRN